MKNRKILFSLFVALIFGVQAGFALNPSRTYKQLPDKYNMKYTAHTAKTSDGAKLKVWHFEANKKTTRLILIAHNGEKNMAEYLRRVDQFTSIGYNVVTFDYRGFGESSDFEIDNNMYIYPHFQDDVKGMIDFVRKTFVQTFDFYGWGIGAGLGLGIGWNRNEIKRIVADTPFLSMEDLENRFSSWDEPMEVPFAGYDKKFEPIYSMDNDPVMLKNNYKEILLIVGSNDILFKESDYAEMMKKKKKNFVKSVYVVENPDRKDNFRVKKAEYFGKMSDFLQNGL